MMLRRPSLPRQRSSAIYALYINTRISLITDTPARTHKFIQWPEDSHATPDKIVNTSVAVWGGAGTTMMEMLVLPSLPHVNAPLPWQRIHAIYAVIINTRGSLITNVSARTQKIIPKAAGEARYAIQVKAATPQHVSNMHCHPAPNQCCQLGYSEGAMLVAPSLQYVGGDVLRYCTGYDTE